MRKSLIVVVWVLLLGHNLAKGEEPALAADAPPRAVAEAMFEATRAHDWERFASLMHPEALERFREILLPILRLHAQQHDGQMPAEFAPATDINTLEGMTPPQFFASFMGALVRLGPRWARR